MAQTFPRITANILSADNGVQLGGQKIIVFGQKLASGSAVSGSLQSDIITETQINSLFGRKSHIAKKLRAILKNLSISRIKPQIDAIALSDNGTTKATGTFTFTGTATENGIINVYIDSQLAGKYSISVVTGDTATVIAGKLASLVTANLDATYTASNLAGVVTVTAENAGTNGNQIRLGFDGSVAGVTVAKSGDYLTGGATNPVLTSLFDPINSLHYQTIDYPSCWDLDVLKNFTEARFNVDNDVLYGQGFTFRIDTYANLNTLLDGLNQKTLCVGFSKLGGGILENPDVINSQFCAYRALLLTEGSNVSSINSGNQQTVGGIRWATIPYFNMPFINLPVIPQGSNFSKEEIEALEASGGWTFENNPTNTLLLTRQVVTTYKTNELGNNDETFKFLNRMDSLTISREYYFAGLKQRYARYTLTKDLQIPSGLRAIVNPPQFLGTLLKYYDDLIAVGIFQADKKEDFRERVADTIEFNLANGLITTQALLPVNSQLREILIDFIAVIN